MFLGQPENESLTSPVRYILNPHSSYDKSYIDEMTKGYLNTIKKIRENHPVFITTPLPEANVNIPTYMSKLVAYNIGNVDNLKLSNKDYTCSLRSQIFTTASAVPVPKISPSGWNSVQQIATEEDSSSLT